MQGTEKDLTCTKGMCSNRLDLYHTGSIHWILVSQLLGLLGQLFRYLGTLLIFSLVQHSEPVWYALRSVMSPDVVLGGKCNVMTHDGRVPAC